MARESTTTAKLKKEGFSFFIQKCVVVIIEREIEVMKNASTVLDEDTFS